MRKADRILLEEIEKSLDVVCEDLGYRLLRAFETGKMKRVRWIEGLRDETESAWRKVKARLRDDDREQGC